MVLAALDAARHRKDRLQKLAVIQTPVSDRSGATKRKSDAKKASDVHGALSSASTATPSEKVTPDPKHVRTGDGTSAPEPKQLFASPVGENTAEPEGVV